jgi:transcription termination factor NusB
MKILFSLDLNSSYDELEDLSKKIEFVMDPDYSSDLVDNEVEAFILENNPFVQELVLGVKHNLDKIDKVIVEICPLWAYLYCAEMR